MRAIAIAIIAVAALAAAFLFLRRQIRMNEERRLMKQEAINRAVGVIAALTSVVASTATAIATVRKGYDDEIAKLKEQLAGREDVDVSGLDAASASAEAAEAEFAKAAAANTPASDEVHVDDGGTGTAPVSEGGTVVAAEPVIVPDAGDDTAAKSGDDTGKTQGEG